ncbi:MAG: hypothetical protein H6Q52_1865 [Deltaproteobacteria bacterium]|nr:hypothetical protein [Deltaproteobacteria bacterium]
MSAYPIIEKVEVFGPKMTGPPPEGGGTLSETFLAYLFMVALVIVGGIVVYLTAKRMERERGETKKVSKKE